MAQEGNFVVAQASKLTIYSGKAEEVFVRGLNNMSLPLSVSASYTSVAEFGVPVDIQVASGLSYDTVSLSGNFTLRDATQAAFRNWSLNATHVTDMRFYLDQCSFVALDLLSAPGSYYQVGSVTGFSAAKADVYSFNVDIAPAGPSTIFERHVATGVNMAFTAEVAGVTEGYMEDTTTADLDFLAAGFAIGQVCYVDYQNGEDPFMVEISDVTATRLTFLEGAGDSDKIFTGSGIATTAIHAGVKAAFDTSTTACTTTA